VIRVTAAVIERDGKVLIAKRKAGGRFGGLWEFPGGKVEADESPERCLERELLEELGIRARTGPLLCVSRHDYGHLAVELLVFRVSSFSGEVSLVDHSETRWVPMDRLGEYDFPDADRPVIAKLVAEAGS